MRTRRLWWFLSFCLLWGWATGGQAATVLAGLNLPTGSVFDLDATYAQISDATGSFISEAKVTAGTVAGEALHATSTFAANSYFYGSTVAQASTVVPFHVLSAGLASVNFSWDGTLFSTVSGQASYKFTAYAMLEGTELARIEHTDTAVDGDYLQVVMGDTLSFDLTAIDVGKIVEVGLSLETSASGAAETADGTLRAQADFFDTGSISGYSGGITPVPLPPAVWLFGSGLLALLGLGQRARRAA